MKSEYRENLLKNGILGFVTHGNSMWPLIKNKKTSVIVLNKEERLNVFDVALYLRPDGTHVLHRVLEVKPDGYIVRGDCQSDEYKDAVSSWLNDPNREKKIKKYYDKLKLKSRIKKLLTFGKCK